MLVENNTLMEQLLATMNNPNQTVYNTIYKGTLTASIITSIKKKMDEAIEYNEKLMLEKSKKKQHTENPPNDQ